MHQLERLAEHVPASLGSMRQLPGPLAWTKSTSSLSSSGAHGPFLIPLLSQHGVLPMAVGCSPSLSPLGGVGSDDGDDEEWE
jgi:hypothetical protein